MTETIIILGATLGVIISLVTISRLLFYTKAEINTKLESALQHSDLKDEALKQYLVNESAKFRDYIDENKEKTFEKMLDAERENNKARQEIYNALSQNKQLFDNYNREMLEMFASIRQENRDTCNQYMQIVNTVKDELKNDNINRYNELLQLINTKVNIADFDRLEQKFDKVCETITELKTIVQLQLENREDR